MANKARKSLFAYQMPPKESPWVAQELMDQMLTSAVSMSIGRDGEFTAEMVDYPCRRLKVSMDCGPADPPRWKISVKPMGVGAPRGLSGTRQDVAASAELANIAGGLDSAGLAGQAAARARDFVPFLFGGDRDRSLRRRMKSGALNRKHPLQECPFGTTM